MVLRLLEYLRSCVPDEQESGTLHQSSGFSCTWLSPVYLAISCFTLLPAVTSVSVDITSLRRLSNFCSPFDFFCDSGSVEVACLKSKILPYYTA